jgi:D-sedoheptulose 7-phosphate isomerase
MHVHVKDSAVAGLAETIRLLMTERNRVSREFFPREAPRLALACRQMANRFARGGRLLACGSGPYATDAQHVAVEFVHPVIVGKRALPALDVSAAPRALLTALVRPDDIVMGFASPAGDPEIALALSEARARGAQTFALSGHSASYAVASPSREPFVHQEMLEVLYHTLWETVHVYLEYQQAGHDIGATGFLYPFLGGARQDTSALVGDVAASICAKAATDDGLRDETAETQATAVAQAALAMSERIAAGGTVILFGNGGSATDANDFALDLAAPPKPGPSIPAISLSMEPATLSAIANDIGREAMFLRQIIAHSRPGDVAVAISTSGGSANIIAALEEARKRNLFTIALLGYDGGEVVRRGLADIPLVVDCDYIPRIQEVQASTYHVLVDALHLLLRAEPAA